MLKIVTWWVTVGIKAASVRWQNGDGSQVEKNCKCKIYDNLVNKTTQSNIASRALKVEADGASVNVSKKEC